ncbi:DUF5320 domain-containing protein [Candidatus Aerophobetes bacterium]|nr:DUF5320 domain-containing protein [Candidatus Aerophobetes bacterium]
MPFGLGRAGWFLGPSCGWYNPYFPGGGFWGANYPYSFPSPGWMAPYGSPGYGYPYGAAGYGFTPTKEQEKSWLEEQRKVLEAELEDIRRRTEELEKP